MHEAERWTEHHRLHRLIIAVQLLQSVAIIAIAVALAIR